MGLRTRVATALALCVLVSPVTNAFVMTKGDNYSSATILYSNNGQNALAIGAYFPLSTYMLKWTGPYVQRGWGNWLSIDDQQWGGWGTHTSQAGNTSCGWLVVQYDGNVVCYTSQGGSAVWSTSTGYLSGNDVIFNGQDDGNLVVYALVSGTWYAQWSLW